MNTKDEQSKHTKKKTIKTQKKIASTITHDCSLCWFSALCFRTASFFFFIYPCSKSYTHSMSFNCGLCVLLNLFEYNSSAAAKLVDHLQERKKKTNKWNKLVNCIENNMNKKKQKSTNKEYNCCDLIVFRSRDRIHFQTNEKKNHYE